jgi:GT2 family glycosyltransferase
MISATIVLYHTSRIDIMALLACIEMSCIDIVYIIDNSSNDLYRFLENTSDKIRYIHSENRGYGASHNIALQEAIIAGSQFHLILNPDIRFSPDIVTVLTSYMRKHTDVVYILPKVLYPDGSIQHLCKLLPNPLDLIFRRFMPNARLAKKLNDIYVLRSSGYNTIINPPCLSGCFMFIQMQAIKKHNLFFDERFFMYCEDIDFIRRLHRVGKTIYYPCTSIIHDHAQESYKSKKMMIEHIKSAVKYFNKWGWFFDKERKEMNRQVLEEIKISLCPPSPVV